MGVSRTPPTPLAPFLHLYKFFSTLQINCMSTSHQPLVIQHSRLRKEGKSSQDKNSCETIAYVISDFYRFARVFLKIQNIRIGCGSAVP